MNTKKCSKCGEIKPLTEFSKRKRSIDGLDYYCKKCKQSNTRKYNEANRHKIKQYNQEYYIVNKDAIVNRVAIYKKNNRDKVLDLKKRYYLQTKNEQADFNIYIDKLTKDELPKLASDGISLEVRCRYCGKYFIPTNAEAQIRLRSLNNVGKGDGYFYCSNNCKASCPTYGQVKYPKDYKSGTSREVSQLVRQLCFERDNYTCQNCGATQKDTQLHCHHLIPVAEIPQFADDVVNTTTLCKDCHIRAHKEPGMTYAEIKTRSYC